MKLRFALLTLALAIGAFAADVSGKWTAEVKGRQGQTREVTMKFKVDGAALTGTIGGMGGDAEIKDGKVDGDTITFNVVREFNGNTVKINYTGKVDGDTIKFTQQRDGGQGQGTEFTAKKSAD
jgi:adenine-specific DNA methylase